MQTVDLVLLDVHMPQMSVIQTLERLRAGPGPNHDAPVVAVTGDTTRLKRDYVALGFDDYANKPISLAAVKAMLCVRREPAFPPIYGEGTTARRSEVGR